MRKALVAMLASVMACGAVTAAPIKQSDIDDCKVFGQMASVIMDLRQMGAKMSDLMKPDTDDAGLENSLIVEAFSTPQYQTDKGKKQAVHDFENQIFMECAKQRRSVERSR